MAEGSGVERAAPGSSVSGTPWSLGVRCDRPGCAVAFESDFWVPEDSTRESGDLSAYLDWPVTVKVGGIWCEAGRECPNPRCDGNGSTEIRAGMLMTPRELTEWIAKHAEAGR